jgi:5-methyltetrahydrofolate--homocysteine methyltransferase
MTTILERLRAGERLLFDGGLGTMLIARGLGPGVCPESIVLTHPEWLVEIASAYAEAGADFVTTNTFGGSPLRLALHGLQDSMERINHLAVEQARAAVDRRAWIAGSVGPSGRILKPYGDADPQDVLDSYGRQIEVLVQAGVDVIAVETMMDPAEARLAIAAARAVSREVPVFATMTFDATPRGFRTVMGTTVETAARELAEAGADVVGSNCGSGIESMIGVAREFRAHTTLPILIQPNAGLPERDGGAIVYRETPEFMAARTRELLEMGVSIVGGCCGTTPDHIRALRRALDAAPPGENASGRNRHRG